MKEGRGAPSKIIIVRRALHKNNETNCLFEHSEKSPSLKSIIIPPTAYCPPFSAKNASDPTNAFSNTFPLAPLNMVPGLSDEVM